MVLALLMNSCSESIEPHKASEILIDSPAIEGKIEYLDSPFVTSGNRVYMVGHQNGTFPEIGWHIKGEMGGIWNHPIKLFDGFDAALSWDNTAFPLDTARIFVNYPTANSHHYDIPEKQLKIERLQFVPDDKEGIYIQYVFKNNSDSTNEFVFHFNGHSDLRPTWLGERTRMVDGEDNATFLANTDNWVFKDGKNEWYAVLGATQKSVEHKKIENTFSGIGISGQLSYKVSIPSGETKTLDFVIAGSYNSKDAALHTFEDIKANASSYLNTKKLRYEKLSEQSKLTIPDKRMEQAFEWLKYNCDWLVQTVPEIGTGITAGIPDYPWWFGVDSEYALKGYMAIGQSDAVYNTIKLLDSVSNAVNGNGKIIHEMSTNGAVFNEGNINETPQFTSLIWEIYKWNGDKSFLRKYFPIIKKGLEWLMQENDANKNLFPDGFGMMEIHGLNSEMIDVAVYTQRAFEDASYIAAELNETDLELAYQETAYTLKRKINNEFWSEEFNSFADFIGTDEQALHLIEDAILRADTLNKPWAVKELKETENKIKSNPSSQSRPFVLHHNWVVNTPMEMHIADSTKALRALKTAEKFVNPFGVFVTGIDRDDSAGSNDGSFKGSKVFSYTGAVMTLPTGVQIVAENNYGRSDMALNYLKRMTRTFSYALPGSIYEVSPDYGMMTQAWNIYSYAVPIVNQFFGVRPDAARKKIVIKPQMPSEWDIASLENIVVDDNSVSIFYDISAGGLNLKVTQTKPDWTIEIVLPKKAYSTFTTSENTSRKEEGGFFIFTAKQKQIEVGITSNKL